MPHARCPYCQRPQVLWLEHSSANAHVNYYLCRACAGLWAVSKDAGDTAPRVVASGQPIAARLPASRSA
jgi:hypothetical protein